jgi:hypothetical protein
MNHDAREGASLISGALTTPLLGSAREGEEMTDRYTKIVLTVIAVMLTIIAVRDLVPATLAQTPQHIILDGVAHSADWGGSFGPLPVKIKN